MLLPIELSDLPFVPRRIFVVTDVPVGVVRGQHLADCRELLVCVRPQIDLTVGTESAGRKVSLGSVGAHHLVEPGEFIRYRHSRPDAVLLVLADQEYRSRAPETIPPGD